MRASLIIAIGLFCVGQSLAQNPNVPLSQSSLATQVIISNAASTGTTINKLAKLTGAPSTAVIAATTDAAGVIGVVIAGAGTNGRATIQTSGLVKCAFDGSTTAGDYVQISSMTTGDCKDGGSTLPSSGQVLGIVLTTNSGAGLYQMDLTGGAGGGGGGGGSSAQHYSCAAGSQGGNGAGNFSFPASNGQATNTNYVPVSNSAGGNIDSYFPLNQGTTVLWCGPYLLDSSFADPITVKLRWMTTSTTGTFIPTLGVQCIAAGGIGASNGFATSGTGFATFVSSTANGTASHVVDVTPLSFTSGCAQGTMLYVQLAWPVSGGGTLSGVPNILYLDMQFN